MIIVLKKSDWEVVSFNSFLQKNKILKETIA